MKTIKLSILDAVVLMACAGTVKAQNVDDIMDKHQKAIGGTENWDKIKTLKLTGSMTQQGMEIGLTETLSMGKAMRMDIAVMGMSGYQIVTTTAGWMYMPFQGSTKVDTMKPELVKMAQRQLDIKGNQLLDYKAKGTKAEYVGKDTVNNAPCYKIKFTDKDGNESVSFFDMASYYLLRTEAKVKIDDQETETAVLYNNYKKMEEGVVMPMSVTAQGMEVTFKSIELNKPIDESVFIPTVPDAKK